MSRLPPLRLAQLAVASSLMICVVPVTSLLPLHLSRSHLIELLVISMVPSFSISLTANRRIHAGLPSWEDDSVASVRRWLNSWPTNAILFFIAALWLADIVEDLMIPHHMGTAGMLIFPVTSILDLRRQFNPKPAPTHEPVWQNLKPIQSNHWGEHPGSSPSA